MKHWKERLGNKTVDVIRIEVKNRHLNLHPKTYDLRENWGRILHYVAKFKGDCDTMVTQAVIQGFCLGYSKGVQDKDENDK